MSLNIFDQVHVVLAEWIKHLLLILKAWGSNPALSKNTNSLPRKPRGSLGSRIHRYISELSEGGGLGVKPRKPIRLKLDAASPI